jgi:hypothetical protein
MKTSMGPLLLEPTSRLSFRVEQRSTGTTISEVRRRILEEFNCSILKDITDKSFKLSVLQPQGAPKVTLVATKNSRFSSGCRSPPHRLLL